MLSILSFCFFFLSLVIYFPYSVHCCCFCPRRKIFKSKQNTLIICTWYHHNNKINFFFLVGTTNVNDEKKILNDTHASVKIAKKHYNNNEDNPFVSLCLHCSILFIHTVHILFKWIQNILQSYRFFCFIFTWHVSDCFFILSFSFCLFQSSIM